MKVKAERDLQSFCLANLDKMASFTCSEPNLFRGHQKALN